MSKDKIIVQELYLYPVKSAKGLTLQGSLIDKFGLEFDRRWMIIDENSCFVTQRECPKMATLQTQIKDSFLRLSMTGVGNIEIPLNNSSGKDIFVTVWNDKVRAKDCGNEVAYFLKKALSRDYRLVFMELPDRKIEGVDKKIFPFSDSSPFLILSHESLEDLNKRLKRPLSMDRFRPNIVTKGGEPYAEDFWAEYKIANIGFKKLKDCSRCQVTTVEQTKGIFDGKEPLKTLAQYRLRNNKVCFGQNAYHLEEGKISVGDSIQILKKLTVPC